MQSIKAQLNRLNGILEITESIHIITLIQVLNKVRTYEHVNIDSMKHIQNREYGSWGG